MLPHSTLSALLLLGLTLSGCSAPPPGGPSGAQRPDTIGEVSQDAEVSPDADGGPTTIVSGATVLTIDDDGLTQRRGEQVLRIPWAGFVLGTTATTDEAMNYDPGYLYPGLPLAELYTPPDALVWRPAAGATWGSDGGEATVDLDHLDGTRSHLTIARLDGADGHIAMHWLSADGPDIPVFYRIALPIAEEERFYGLGEFFDHVEHRGRRRTMHFQAAELESGYNEMHVPVPLLIATSGWGMFVESYRAGVFDLAMATPDQVEITFGLGAAGPTEGLSVRLFSADHPLDLTGRYYDATGYPGAVAEWALGPWIWRDEVADQAAVEQDLIGIRAMDLATTGYWIDRPYASAVNSFDFEPSAYPDPQAMIDLAQGLGMRMALWHTPYTDPDDVDSQALYQHASDSGFFPPLLPTAVANWGPPLDFSNVDAVAWWQSLVQTYVDMGIEGFKLDYGQEVVVGAFGARLTAAFSDGSDELTMHRRYAILYHRTYAELLPTSGGFLLCRAGSWGDQVNGVIIWPGDIDATFDTHGEASTDRHDDEPFNAVGGLPAAVVAGSSLGPSGFPLFGADTGGYRHSPPDREVYLRWITQSALSPVMQVGTNTNDLPWSFGDPKILDQEVLDIYRVYARLHLRLWPYLWTYLSRVQADGRAIQRPLGLAHPELGSHPDDVYLLGDSLLVAPVVERGVTQRTFTLPQGTWIDWWTGAEYVGGGPATVPAPLDALPFLVRQGHPIPLLRDSIDTLSSVVDPDAIDSYATTPHPLWVWVAPGGSGAFTLFDGTALTQRDAGTSIELTRTAGAVFDGPMVWRVIGVTEAQIASVSDGETVVPVRASRSALDNADSGVLYDHTTAPPAALVKVPASSTRVSLVRN